VKGHWTDLVVCLAWAVIAFLAAACASCRPALVDIPTRATVTAPVTVSIPTSMPVSATAEVDAEANVEASADVAVIRRDDHSDRRREEATTQAASADRTGDQTAGGDASSRDLSIPITASGSGWPVVAVVSVICACAAACLLGLAWLRTAGKHRLLTSAAADVATAIGRAGPDATRNDLLWQIEQRLSVPSSNVVSLVPPPPRRRAWDALVRRTGCYVRRSTTAAQPERGGGRA